MRCGGGGLAEIRLESGQNEGEVIHFKKGIAKYAKVSSTPQKCLDLDSSYLIQEIIFAVIYCCIRGGSVAAVVLWWDGDSGVGVEKDEVVVRCRLLECGSHGRGGDNDVELTQEEFNDFLALYPIPPEYGVMLPKSNQTIFDAPSGYVGLCTHSFSLLNLSSIVPAEYPQLLIEQNRWDSKSYKDKLPTNIEKNPMFQRLEMAFRNFIYAENVEDLSFYRKPLLNLSEDTADSGGSPKPELHLVFRPPGATVAKAFPSKDDTPFLSVSDDDEGYQFSLSALESKVASMEAEKARLEVVEASLKKEVDDVKRCQNGGCYNLRQVPVPSSQRDTSSFAPASNLMSPHVAVSSVNPQASQAFLKKSLLLRSDVRGDSAPNLHIMYYHATLFKPASRLYVVALLLPMSHTLPASITSFLDVFLAIDYSLHFEQFCITFTTSLCIDGQ
ncbi:hypothetical protein Tco_0602448 [Tanacetum coccineum]